MSNPLLVYDDQCTYCEGIASTFEKIDEDIQLVDWNDETVQEFLDAQFGWQPFVMMVINNGTVYVGEEAVKHLTSTVGVPKIAAEAVKSQTEPVSTIVSKLARRREPDNINGEFPLDEVAKEIISSFREDTQMTEIPINSSDG